MKDNVSCGKIWFFVVSSLTVLFLSFVIMAGSKETKPVARSLTVSVDPRVELISIIFQLAGNPEYNKGRMVGYISDIEKQFGPYRGHPVVKLAADLRKKYGVSYDAPMSLAVHLEDTNNLEMRVPLEPRPVGLDGRWRADDVKDFLEKARQFAQESNFDDFIKEHQPMYDRAVTRLQSLLEKEAHLEWFDDFFGARPGAEFHIALGIVNGPSNYGPHIKLADREEYYCILGVWRCRFFGLGEPKFDKKMLPTVIHEFCHSYANRIVDAHLTQLEKPGIKIFEKIRDRMQRMAYGNWQTMMRESLVRACVVRYMAETEGSNAAQRQINREIGLGFSWIPELSDLLAQYEQQRDKYPTVDTFFPNIVDFFNGYQMD
jgi:hypothetical protein